MRETKPQLEIGREYRLDSIEGIQIGKKHYLGWDRGKYLGNSSDVDVFIIETNLEKIYAFYDNYWIQEHAGIIRHSFSSPEFFPECYPLEELKRLEQQDNHFKELLTILKQLGEQL